MGLVVSQYQGGTMAFVGWDFQGKIDPSKGNGGKGWRESRAVSPHNRLKSSQLFTLRLLQNKLFASPQVSPAIIPQLKGH